MRRWLPLLLLGLTACGGDAPPAPGGQGLIEPPRLEHDFGVIPHGKAASRDYVFDPQRLPFPCVPLRAQLDCSCGRAELLVRGADGTERPLDGSPSSANAPGPGEHVVVRVTIDTLVKDPVDLVGATSRGYLLLQPLHDRDGSQRIQWPFLVRFGIETPVVVTPFAALDFGRVPRSTEPVILTTLRGDASHPGIGFGAVTSTSPDLTGQLEAAADHTVLRVRCKPTDLGNHRAVLSVATDLPDGYRVNLGVTWKVVPDLEAAPMAKLSFRASLDRAQAEAEAADQYLVLTDHLDRRAGEFALQSVVADDGRDATAHFAITFQPLGKAPQTTRMNVRYLGGLSGPFRGRVLVGKGASEADRLALELVVFAAKAP